MQYCMKYEWNILLMSTSVILWHALARRALKLCVTLFKISLLNANFHKDWINRGMGMEFSKIKTTRPANWADWAAAFIEHCLLVLHASWLLFNTFTLTNQNFVVGYWQKSNSSVYRVLWIICLLVYFTMFLLH